MHTSPHRIRRTRRPAGTTGRRIPRPKSAATRAADKRTWRAEQGA